MRYLIFLVKEEYFGIDVFKVVEIIKPTRFYHVYDLPDFIEGLINLRGELIPIVSMRKRFGIDESPSKSRIIIVKIEDEKIGLQVDSVVEIAEIPPEKISKPSKLFKGFKAEFIESVAELKDNRVAIILNLNRVLTTEEKILLKSSKDRLEKDN